MKRKGWVNACGVFLLSFCICTPAGALDNSNVTGAAFTDIRGFWAEDAISGAMHKGYVAGYEDGTFRPEREVTRAEFVAMMDNALGIPVPKSTPEQIWYEPFIDAAVKSGIHQWSDFNSGDWNTALTREELARLAVRAIGVQNEVPTKWMYLATEKGILAGLNEFGTLGEKKTTTRAQSVAVIERILNLKSGQILPVDKHAIANAEILWHKTNMMTVLPSYFSTPVKNRWEDVEKAMTQVTDGGTNKCEVQKFVLIDLDDPNDPNLKDLPDDLIYSIWNEEQNKDEYHPIPTNGYYAALSVNHFSIQQKNGIGMYQPCSVSLKNFPQKLNAKSTATARFDPNIEGGGSWDGEDHRTYPCIRTETAPTGATVCIRESKSFESLQDQEYVTVSLFPKNALRDSDKVTVSFVPSISLGNMQSVSYTSQVNLQLLP